MSEYLKNALATFYSQKQINFIEKLIKQKEFTAHTVETLCRLMFADDSTKFDFSESWLKEELSRLVTVD